MGDVPARAVHHQGLRSARSAIGPSEVVAGLTRICRRGDLPATEYDIIGIDGGDAVRCDGV